MERKSRKRRFRLRHIMIIGLLIYLVIVFINQQQRISKLESQKESKNEEVKELEKEIGYLQEKIKHTDSLDYIEKIAREELKMIKPGEIIYIDKDKNENKDKFIDNTNN